MTYYCFSAKVNLMCQQRFRIFLAHVVLYTHECVFNTCGFGVKISSLIEWVWKISIFLQQISFYIHIICFYMLNYNLPLNGLGLVSSLMANLTLFHFTLVVTLYRLCFL